MKIADFVARGLNGVENDMGEIRNSRMGDENRNTSIVFPNGLVASVLDRTVQKRLSGATRYSVAVCDYNGYFDWDILIPFGANVKGTEGYGCFETNDENEVCRILSIIENLE